VTDGIRQIDPTTNVLNLVKEAMKRQDDLREQADKFQILLAKQRFLYEKEAKDAESRRIDALLLANKNDVALALERNLGLSAAQDKRIALVEQNQYLGVGATGQRAEGRQHSQWVIGLVIGILTALAVFLSRHF
jgi:hypothetical protein